jgi:hypothetical protein
MNSHPSVSVTQSDIVKQGLTFGYSVELMEYTGIATSKLSPTPVDKHLPSKYFSIHVRFTQLPATRHSNTIGKPKPSRQPFR